MQGIQVLSGTGHSIRGNSISGHSVLGIDIDPGGVTANDALDVDGGPNNTQNFPMLTTAITTGGTTTIDGELDSLPITDFHLEFFANSVCR